MVIKVRGLREESFLHVIGEPLCINKILTRRASAKLLNPLPCWLWNDLLSVTFTMKFTRPETFL